MRRGKIVEGLELLLNMRADILSARPSDVIVFHVPNDVSEETIAHLKHLIDVLTQSLDVTAALIPENFKVEVRNYSLTDLIELREELEEIIFAVSTETAVGDA